MGVRVYNQFIIITILSRNSRIRFIHLLIHLCEILLVFAIREITQRRTHRAHSVGATFRITRVREGKEFFSGSPSRISIKASAVRWPPLHFDIALAITRCPMTQDDICLRRVVSYHTLCPNILSIWRSAYFASVLFFIISIPFDRTMERLVRSEQSNGEDGFSMIGSSQHHGRKRGDSTSWLSPRVPCTRRGTHAQSDDRAGGPRHSIIV